MISIRKYVFACYDLMMPDSAASVADRLAALEARLSALEGAAAVNPPRPPAGAAGQWWILDGLARHDGPAWERADTSGAIAFAGRVHTPGAGDVTWQVEHPAHAPLHLDLAAAAGVLAALGHPVRLALLRALLDGATTVAELNDISGMGTSGQLAHHLRELRAAGLVVSARRNHYAVAPDRVVPILVMIAAAVGPAALLAQQEPALSLVPATSPSDPTEARTS